MAVKLDALKEYIRTGNKDALEAASLKAYAEFATGGYLMPRVIINQRPGLLGWIYRLFKDKRGWEEYDIWNLIKEYKIKR